MYFKSLNISIFCFLSLLFLDNIKSQNIEFPEDKVNYTIKIIQNACEVSIIADIEVVDGGRNLPKQSDGQLNNLSYTELVSLESRDNANIYLENKTLRAIRNFFIQLLNGRYHQVVMALFQQ